MVVVPAVSDLRRSPEIVVDSALDRHCFEASQSTDAPPQVFGNIHTRRKMSRPPESGGPRGEGGGETRRHLVENKRYRAATEKMSAGRAITLSGGVYHKMR